MMTIPSWPRALFVIKPHAMHQPTPHHERIPTIDVLRGVALLGILLVNMELFNRSLFATPPTPANWLDQLTRWGVTVFVEGTFYNMFAMLFGVGMAMQFQRGHATAAHGRRLLALLAIGIAHGYLVWVGDVLTLYAICGIALLLFRKATPATALACAVATFALSLFTLSLFELLSSGQPIPHPVAVGADSIYKLGTFSQITSQRAAELAFIYGGLTITALGILPAMLLGVAVGKLGILANIPRHHGLLKAVQRWGLLVGLGGNLAHAWGAGVASVVGKGLGDIALTLCYMATIALLLQNSPAWRARMAPVAAAGRMALTNYLAQSILCTTLFYGYGLGWYGIGATAGVLLAVAIYGLQLFGSVWLLKRFPVGPAEWLWRSLTYLRPPPMVKA